MPKKRFGAEQIVTLLRQIEVLMAQGKSPPEACREAGISQQSYYLCVPKILSALISRKNRLTSAHHDRAAVFRNGRLGRAIQVEEPA